MEPVAAPTPDFLNSLGKGWKPYLKQMASTEPKSWWHADFAPGVPACLHLPKYSTFYLKRIAQSKKTDGKIFVSSQLMIDHDGHKYIVSVSSCKALVVTQDES